MPTSIITEQLSVAFRQHYVNNHPSDDINYFTVTQGFINFIRNNPDVTSFRVYKIQYDRDDTITTEDGYSHEIKKDEINIVLVPFNENEEEIEGNRYNYGTKCPPHCSTITSLDNC
jgi:hypothetical protein